MSINTLEALLEGPLQSRTDATLTEGQRGMLQRLESFTAPYLQEKLRTDEVVTDPAAYEQAFGEFKKYAALSTMHDKPLGMTSKEVDAVWHQFVLFTREYAAFTETVLDGDFLHHSPKTSMTPLQEGAVENFRVAYKNTFGAIPEIWGKAAECADDGADCGDGGSACDNN